MKTLTGIVFGFFALLSWSVFAATAETPFIVHDLPRPEPIAGQLGEPGAPSLTVQQTLLAKALLSKGLCHISYYGAEFCARQKTKTFKVTDQLGNTAPDSVLLGEKDENF